MRRTLLYMYAHTGPGRLGTATIPASHVYAPPAGQGVVTRVSDVFP